MHNTFIFLITATSVVLLAWAGAACFVVLGWALNGSSWPANIIQKLDEEIFGDFHSENPKYLFF